VGEWKKIIKKCEGGIRKERGQGFREMHADL
jgi:hypothetical protein